MTPASADALTERDTDIEFDFFDEPATAEETQRRRLPRLDRSGGRGGGERPPFRTPTGLAVSYTHLTLPTIYSV